MKQGLIYSKWLAALLSVCDSTGDAWLSVCFANSARPCVRTCKAWLGVQFEAAPQIQTASEMLFQTKGWYLRVVVIENWVNTKDNGCHCMSLCVLCALKGKSKLQGENKWESNKEREKSLISVQTEETKENATSRRHKWSRDSFTSFSLASTERRTRWPPTHVLYMSLFSSPFFFLILSTGAFISSRTVAAVNVIQSALGQWINN